MTHASSLQVIVTRTTLNSVPCNELREISKHSLALSMNTRIYCAIRNENREMIDRSLNEVMTMQFS
jgi:hypothetical protein